MTKESSLVNSTNTSRKYWNSIDFSYNFWYNKST